MTKKIEYTVIDVTGEEEGYLAKNLENHHPTTHGWKTQRFCEYPQEIILHLCESCRMKKVQLLSHQYLISTKIEFYVATATAPEDFKRLGYVHLSSNEENDFKSRELKSVHIDAEGQYLKLFVHKNYENNFNPYNQVGVIALSILAEPLYVAKNYLNAVKNNDQVSISSIASSAAPEEPSVDDLLYDMYMDPQVVSVLRKLDIKKRKAISEEQFDEAKRMKLAIDDFQQVGNQLARLELEKQQAISEENYDLAKSKKSEMDEFRLKFFENLRKHNLIEELGIFNKESTSSLQNLPSRTTAPDVRSQNIFQTLSDSQSTPYSQYSGHSVQHSGHSVASHHMVPSRDLVSFQSKESRSRPFKLISHDDRVIPTLDKHRTPDPFLAQMSSSSMGAAEEFFTGPSEPEPLSEVNIREAKSIIDVFGLPLVTKAYSKVWSYRENALVSAHQIINGSTDGLSKEEIRKHVRAVSLLLAKLIKDHVYAVHQASLSLLEATLVDFIPRHKLGKVEITQVIAHTLPALIQKTGETAPRGRNSALNFILRMIAFGPVHSLHVVPQRLLSPIGRETSHRLALSRVEMVSGLLKQHGLKDDSIDLDSIMKFSLEALEHSSGAVREEAIKLIHAIYRLVGPSLRAYFPPAESLIRKRTLHRHIFDGFEQIDREHGFNGFNDGKSAHKQAHISNKDRSQQHKPEIGELRSQINHLDSLIDDYRQVHPSNIERRKRGAESNKPHTYQPEKVFVTPHPNPSAKIRTFEDDSSDSSMESDTMFEQTCIFCGEKDNSFTEDGLDFHYWRHCPMLKRCLHCKQVVEICNFSEHLLTECDGKEKFQFCPRCSEAVLKVDFDCHIASKRCPVLKPNQEEHCPLCHKNIPYGEESWQRHLMGSNKDACRENPRRKPALKRLTSNLSLRDNLQFPLSL